MAALKATGKIGSWFARVGGEQVPCIHKHWLSAMHYKDPFKGFDVTKDRKLSDYIEAIKSGKIVVLTDDHVERDGNGNVCGFKRKGYVGLYRVDNVIMTESNELSFDLVERLASLA